MTNGELIALFLAVLCGASLYDIAEGVRVQSVRRAVANAVIAVLCAVIAVILIRL